MPRPWDDLAKLEQNFKDAVGGLPNYKRTVAFEYVNALSRKIEALAKEVNDLANENVGLRRSATRLS